MFSPLLKILSGLAIFLLLSSFLRQDNKPVASKVEISQCLENCEIRETIFSSAFTPEAYSLNFGIQLNCATRQLYQVTCENDTLRLNFQPKGHPIIRTVNGVTDTAYAMTGSLCDCYFKIGLEIRNLDSAPKCIIVNKRRFDPVKGFVKLDKLGREEN